MDAGSVALLLIAAYGWGSLLLPPALEEGEVHFLRFGVGVAAVSALVASLGLVGLLRPAPILGCLYTGAFAGMLRAGAARRGHPERRREAAKRLSWGAFAAVAFLAIVTLWRGLERDRGVDPYHAFLAKAYLLAGDIDPFPGVVESTYSMSWEMLNVAAFAHGTGGQPAMLSAVALGIAAWGVAILLGGTGRSSAVLGSLVLVTNPLLVRTAATSHNECGQVLLVVSALVAINRFRREGTPWALLAACGLLGTLAGTKETAGVTLVIPCLVVLLYPGGARPAAAGRPALVVAALLLLLPSTMWLIRKVEATGNPLYPLATDRLKTDAVYRASVDWFRRVHPGAGGLKSPSHLIELVRLQAVDGSGEPLFGFVAAGLLFSRRARAKWGPTLAGAATAFFAAALAPEGQTRFLAPSIPFFVLVAGPLGASGFAAAGPVMPRLSRVGWSLVLLGVFVRYPQHTIPLYRDLGDLLRLPPFTWQARSIRALENDPAAAALSDVNRRLSGSDRLLVVSPPRHLEFLDVPFVPPSHFQWDLGAAFRVAGRDFRKELGITALLRFPDVVAPPLSCRRHEPVPLPSLFRFAGAGRSRASP